MSIRGNIKFDIVSEYLVKCFSERVVQAKYYGSYKPSFMYVDTDSIHCDKINRRYQNDRKRIY